MKIALFLVVAVALVVSAYPLEDSEAAATGHGKNLNCILDGFCFNSNFLLIRTWTSSN